jgi:hypothetical protein
MWNKVALAKNRSIALNPVCPFCCLGKREIYAEWTSREISPLLVMAEAKRRALYEWKNSIKLFYKSKTGLIVDSEKIKEAVVQSI